MLLNSRVALLILIEIGYVLNKQQGNQSKRSIDYGFGLYAAGETHKIGAGGQLGAN
jgi:hypothetical protein